jgi:hypothetical protein
MSKVLLFRSFDVILTNEPYPSHYCKQARRIGYNVDDPATLAATPRNVDNKANLSPRVGDDAHLRWSTTSALVLAKQGIEHEQKR